MVGKCKSIVESLGKFFEDLNRNNQDTFGVRRTNGQTKISPKRASEMLHELSASMEHAFGMKSKSYKPTCSDKVPRDDRLNTNQSKTSNVLWDKLCQEVAYHEFTYDPISPRSQDGEYSKKEDDRHREIERAEKGLQRMIDGTLN